MPPYQLLTLGRFLVEDPVLMAMHTYERAWGDLLCDDFQDWKENVASLCAPELEKVAALHTPNDKAFADPTPSRNASPLFTEPAIAATRVASPLFTEPAIAATVPVVAALFAAARSASPLFTEPIPAPVVEVKHVYFATKNSIVPTEPFLPPPVESDGIKTIIARNLPRNTSPEDLRERFQLYGVVRDVYLPRNKDPNSLHHGTIRGFALIKYETAAQSARAVRVLSALGLSIRGKQVTVEFAKSDTAARNGDTAFPHTPLPLKRA